ncbi:excinuclease ABC subunit UvrA [Granulicella tundricola]|uniref:UvrABC system protein A n=1 Tax=Granulicella tundricola (strain ATCC BAA-1859 / DSM 23138 / MP5ACTX9) TaxID=1198114 RepID=E8WZI5_GRATM|nr:excinuclease ABC subunit UvrA [Granulicella tundricola]ADW68873.1 excinuclease ABC, A subunit [Granulicella tundricola MP5ACTX9]
MTDQTHTNASPNNQITIRGARTHNLKGIDVDIPHNALTVVSGVSGSGKSSLAFDTVYAEGQRRYVESLSAYARQFLERIEKPDVDHVDGLAPAIAIKQKNQTRNPRSTVATATEIYDYLRLLYARCGTVTCLHCGGIVKRDSVDEIVATILALPEGTRTHALFPITRAEIRIEALQPSSVEETEAPKPAKKAVKKSAKKAATVNIAAATLTDPIKDRLLELRRRGYNRLFQNGAIVEFSTPESLLELDFSKPIFVLIDRLALSPDIRTRLVDAIETGYRESGEIQFHTLPRDEAAPQQFRFSSAFECTTCHRAYREPEPRLFSFNNPFGACPRCQGFGNTIDFDPNLIIPDRSKSLTGDAVAPWASGKYRPHHAEMLRAAKAANIPTSVPWYDLTPAQQSFIEDGSGSFPGIRGFFRDLDRKKYKLHVRVFLSKYRGYALCPDCRGTRLRAEARAVLLSGKNICEVSALTITGATEFFDALNLSPSQMEIAGKVLEEVRQRTHFLHQVGLDYLTLDRLSSTLSGGESQRIQLATSLGSRLVGALYVLDEPSIGLHTRDTAKLIRIMEDLRDLGNTILVVEHDPDVIRAADYLLDLGPGAGELGGQLLAAGTVAEVTRNPASITGKYLSGRLTIPIPKVRREPGRERLKLTGARIHNLRGVDIEIPLNLLCCVTGVSGSGKSTIVHQVLYRALQQALGQTEGADPTGLYRDLSGTQHLNEVILVDQSPIGRTPRSNPVTYIKAFDDIRALFAAQPDAKRKSYAAGAFSFNVPGGRCDVCEGDGTVTVEMQFLADIELPCEECNGTRYKAAILDVKYKGKNIHDVLNMTVKEALVYFAGHQKIVDKLYVLDEVGLSYVRLGQSATTLSGGEAQRVKLASHLATARSVSNRSSLNEAAAKARSRTLYILDEPTTGLHFDDVAKLLAAFRKLIEGGGSLLVIEHNLDVIKSADWVIDMGPEGGNAGGQVVAIGTPEDIAANKASHTGHWLGPVLEATAHHEPIPVHA